MVAADTVDYSLRELSEEVGRRLAAAGVVPASGRVSALPDGRTLRFYTTVGLLDRPLELRDRQARYGERHVLQALAVKSLQAAGESLATIQVALAGLSDDELAAVTEAGAGPASRDAFWAARPADAPAPAQGQASRRPVRSSGAEPTALSPLPTESQTAVTLAPGVELVLRGAWSPELVAAVVAALEPCLGDVAAIAGDTTIGPRGPRPEEDQ